MLRKVATNVCSHRDTSDSTLVIPVMWKLTPGKIRQYQMHFFPPTKRNTTGRTGDLILCSPTKLIGRSCSIQLFGRFTLVRVVLHGLRRSPVANGRFGGEAARSGGICHLLSEYTVARLSRSQS